METAAALRRRAENAVQAGRYNEAAQAYRQEAEIYRRNGDTEGAKVEEAKADRWASSVWLYAHGVKGSRPPSAPARLAKHEPEYGCYLGAFLDRDERAGQAFQDENFQTHRDPEAFARLTGKKLASVFCYVAYGRPFPSRWVEFLKAQNVAPHIAWEPNNGLGVVNDDAYLRGFAQDCARAGCPLFLRYASEMNGGWTRYGTDALQYKIKWGIVRDVMARYAPNVAMVWCVNNIPERTIEKFYPGDEYVDWVGVNLYSVPFFDNSLARVGLYQNPADLLRFVYGRYAKRKPLVICEYGASHQSTADGGRDRSDWAGRKIAELYASLPRLYPRVKMVDIFNNNNLRHAETGRQLNNYSVTDSSVVQAAYVRAVAPDYFLEDVNTSLRPAQVALVPASGFRVRRGILRVSSWARTYSERFSVAYLVNGREAARSTEPGGREAELSLLSPGLVKITAVVRDDKNRIAAQTVAQILVV